jgi:hypothetical protein
MTSIKDRAAATGALLAVLGGLIAVLGALVAVLAANDAPAFDIGVLTGVLVVVVVVLGVCIGLTVSARRAAAEHDRLNAIDPLGGLSQDPER